MRLTQGGSGQLEPAAIIADDVTLPAVAGLPPSELRLVWRDDERSPAVARFVRHAAATI